MLVGTGWLPGPPRLTDVNQAPGAAAEGETEALPDFLAGDDDEALAEIEEKQQHMIAAE